MTISSTTVKNSYSGNGTLDTFNYTFKIFADSDLQVIIRDATATETVKTLTTHYTVTGAGNASGGTIVFTSGNIPTATETVVIRRAVPQTQAIDYIANDPFPAESHEEGLDRSMMTLQQLQEEVDRSIKLSRTNTMNSTEFTIGDTDRANKVFGFDSAGELVVTQELGTFRGDWSASTSYAVRDIIKDTSNNNVYICLTAHTSSGSQPISTNTDSSKWSLLVDAAAATTSANNAATSAAAALVSENNAATSESNAATSEANAAASYDDFDDRYLGAKASNPTVDNDGNALIDGALYFDTTNNVMKVYDLGNTTWRRTTPTTSEQTNINTVSGISSDVTTVASNDTNVTTVATNIASVNTVATNINDVIKVADDLNEAISEVETVANDLNEATSEIEVVANNITNVNTVGTNIANVNTVAGINADVTTVANDGTDIGTVATNIANVNTVAGNNANITTVAGNDANITTVAGISSNVTTVANDTADIGTVASDISNVNTVAGSIANVNTVATNVSDVNNFADRYRVQAGEPSVDNDEGDLVYDTNANAVKVYNGASFDTIQQGITDVAPTRHSIRPSLNLDFANSKVLDPRITFTRASNATYYDGYTSVKAEENLLKYSQEFNNSDWSKTRVTLTADDTTAPDGTTTAEKLAQISGQTLFGGVYKFNFPVINNSYYTFSIFAKAGTNRNFVTLRETIITTGSRYTWFNLSTGAVGTSDSNHTATITDAGNGWYRCSVTVLTARTEGSFTYYVAETDNSTTVTDDQGFIYIWGAQIEQRDSLTAYTPTTSSPITKYQPALQTAGNNVARFDHNPTTGESLGLLIEESRTNKFTRSEELNTWSTVGALTFRTNHIIAPDGTLTADKVIIPDGITSGNRSFYRASNITADATFTVSVYAKSGGLNNFSFFIRDNLVSSNSFSAYFDLSNGTTGTLVASGTATVNSISIEDVGNGWYRCIATGSVGNGATTIQSRIINRDTGNGFDGYYFWGMQVEEGSFPTSYIKTTGSQVTRSDDRPVINNIDTSEWFKQGKGTLYSELSHMDTDITGTNLHFLILRNSTTNDFLGMRFSGNEKIQFLNFNNGSYNVIINSSDSSTLANTYHKASFSFTKDDAKTSLNGTTIGTDTSFNISQFDQLSFNYGSQQFNGHMKKASYYPINLTQNEINDLSEE